MKNYVIAINYKHLASHIPEKYFTELFDKNKNWNKVESDKYNNEVISFIYNSRVSKFYDINSDIGIFFNPSHTRYLTNKYNLYKTLEKYTPETYKKFMVKHYEVDIKHPEKNKDLFTGNKVYILRPSWGFSRKGITIYNNYDDFEKYIKGEGYVEYLKAMKFKSQFDKTKYDDYKYDTYTFVLSDFLQNQLIFKNRLINFRVFNIISLVNNKYRSYMTEPIVIHTSSKERLKNDYSDVSDINNLITGTTYIAKDYYTNDLITEYGDKKTEYMLNQIKHILSILFRVIKYKKVFKHYDNFKNTYDMLGLDFIIDENFNVKLVEINNKVGIADFPDDFYKTFVACIINSTINKLYDKEYHIKIDKNIKKNIIRIHSNKKYL